MSLFKSEVFKVESIEPHGNADKLEVVNYLGWSVIVGKGQFAIGDLAVYIPLDAVLPDSLVQELNIANYYHSRVRAAKLRGRYSQGLLMKPREGWKEGQDVTAELRLIKYEEPIKIHIGGEAAPTEPGMEVYTDIENIKNYPKVFFPMEEVIAFEKVHGSCSRAYKKDGKLFVGSHRMNLKESETSLFWRTARMLNLAETLKDGEEVFWESIGSGVQDLSYGCKNGEVKPVVFDLMVNGYYLNTKELIHMCSDRGWPLVPIVARGLWDDESFLKVHIQNQIKNTPAYLDSFLVSGHLMEGVVIRPVKERFSDILNGRCIVKAINPDYLIRKNPSEGH